MIYLFAFLIANAHAADDLCADPVAIKVERRIPVSDKINFFVRPDLKNEISFASDDGNKILDLDTGKTHTVPGMIDPVVSPDGKLLAVPISTVWDGKNKKFVDYGNPAFTPIANPEYFVMGGGVYRMENGSGAYLPVNQSVADLKKSGHNFGTSYMAIYGLDASRSPKPIMHDEEVTQNYQSLGVLRSSNESTQYRMLFEGNENIQAKDYALNSSGKLEASGPAHSICKIPVSGNLPMLSKDGKSFSVYDVASQSTMIYDVNGGDCKVTNTLAAMVGKADFSPSGKKVAFHLDRGNTHWQVPIPDEFKNPTNMDQMSVVVLDRSSGRMHVVQDRKDENSYYPVFLGEDKIAYISATKGEDQKFFVNIVHLDREPGVACPNCTTDPVARQKASFLGYLYSKKCQLGDSSFRTALSGLTRLNSARCHLLLKQTSDSDLRDVAAAAAADNARNLPIAQNGSIDNSNGTQWDPNVYNSLKKSDLESLCESVTSPVDESKAAH